MIAAAVLAAPVSASASGLASEPIPEVNNQQAAPASRLPAPTLRVTFREAIDQAIQRNPSVQQASAEILRAEGLLSQARSAILPGLAASVVTVTQSQGPAVFNGEPVTPRNQVTGTVGLSAPLFAPALWAQRVQAQDEVHVEQVSAADVRRQVAVATAQAYLSIIARRRVFEANVRARDTATAHYELAHAQLSAGAGSLLNQLRAQQVVSADDVLVEEASLDVYRAQEALGVLVGDDGPVDTSDEPVLEVPTTLQAAEAAMPICAATCAWPAPDRPPPCAYGRTVRRTGCPRHRASCSRSTCSRPRCSSSPEAGGRRWR